MASLVQATLAQRPQSSGSPPFAAPAADAVVQTASHVHVRVAGAEGDAEREDTDEPVVGYLDATGRVVASRHGAMAVITRRNAATDADDAGDADGNEAGLHD